MTFLKIAFTRGVVINALKITFVVGSMLAVINHGSAIINLNLPLETVTKILLSYLVPYCVSTYSAVKAIQNNR